MRSPFNATCDIFKGPGSSNPGLFVGTFDCRVVLADAIEAIGLGSPSIPAYLTIKDYEPQGCWTYPAFGMDSTIGDRVIVPSGGLQEYVVLFTDVIFWQSQPYYYRAYLSFPGPDTLFRGGLVVSGGATLYPFAAFIGSGGVLMDGSGVRGLTSVGGVLMDGSGVRGLTSVGGVLMDGSGVRGLTSVGGVLIGGAASYPPIWRINDKFNVSDQTNNGRVPDTTNVPGGTWSNTNGAWSVVSNTLQATTLSGGGASTKITNGQRPTEIRVNSLFDSANGSNYSELDILYRYIDGSNFSYGGVTKNHSVFGNSIFIIQYFAGVGAFVVGPTTITVPYDTPTEFVVTDDGTNVSFAWGTNTVNYSSTVNNTATDVIIGGGAIVASASWFDDFRMK